MAVEQMITGNEPGEVDNRMSVSTSDERWAEQINNWEDGEEYEATVRLRQISPGEFEVVEFTSEEVEEEPAEVAETPKKAKGAVSRNPAIIALIGARKK